MFVQNYLQKYLFQEIDKIEITHKLFTRYFIQNEISYQS